MVIRVLFVCLGNICRSPMAEGMFRAKVEAAGLSDQIRIDSAATGNWNLGNPPHRGTQQILTKHGIDYSQMRARLIGQEDFADFDYVIGMDGSNMQDLEALKPADSPVVLKKLMDFAAGEETTDVPDPYYTGNFDETERLVSAGCEGLLSAIRERFSL
ncbi:low molecular weight phosphotyrosine protein phosphatase [Listeria grandensis]|uniref:low molecular weight protein-tyrosine-phosphatase n=1 Tax=Listeria grandensis TaxID=1494963 RepID=UPI001625BB01|nr:low molecular weight protein-tyrosine-phosphatase [Listeria grandensis]MBC1473552.1 low molecular weight phosphotyrosine protein phosphatase [Listeria grandensis]